MQVGNSPRGSTNLPQRNVLPPRCLTLQLYFLKPLYLFSVVLSGASLFFFYRFYSSFFPSLSQIVHSFLGFSLFPLPFHTTPFFAVLPSSWPSRFYRRRQQIYLILLFNLTEDAIFFLISTLTISRERWRADGVKRESKSDGSRNFIDSIVEKRRDGRAKRERMRH